MQDGAVKEGKSLCISRQSHFWCIKGETEDEVLTDASVGDVCKYVETNFKKCMIDFKKSKKGESLPFTVQYKDIPAYEGCFMSQNKKQEKVKGTSSIQYPVRVKEFLLVYQGQEYPWANVLSDKIWMILGPRNKIWMILWTSNEYG